MGDGRTKRTKDVFDQKIRNKMLLRVLVTATAILLALAAVTFWITRSLLATELKHKSQNKVELVSSRIERWLDKRGEVMKLVAAREGRQPTSKHFKQEYFREIAKRYGGVESAYIGYPDGSFVTGADWTPPADYDPRKRPWYVQAKQRGDVIFSTPYRDAMSKRLVTTVAVPIIRAGKLLAVMGMDIFIDDLVATVNSLKIGTRSRAYLVNENGLYIAHPDAAAVLEQKIDDSEASHFRRASKALAAGDDDTRSVIYEGGGNYVLIARIDAAGWYLFFHLPKSQVNEPLRFLALVFAIGILAALVVLALTVNYISSKIARPILALAEGASDIAEGDYERRIEVASRDEVGYLTQSFNDMAEGLGEREFIRTTFGRYVSEDVMKDILEGNLELGGQTRKITILFSDIRDFTKLSEKMEAQDLVELLNSYFERMDRAITAAGGSINKYLGDGILAIFGAPQRLENSQLAAVTAARDMLRVELPELNKELDLNLAIGIGIHSGEAVVGNIGSTHRTEYTTIGDAVNTASRIESLTKRYGEALLVSQVTADQLDADEWVMRAIDRVRVVGKSEATTLYAPYRADYATGERKRQIEAANVVMKHYFAGEFSAALAAIDDAPQADKHLQLIRARCEQFIAEPPDEWDGAFTMDRK